MNIKPRHISWLLLLLAALLGLGSWGLFSAAVLPPAVQVVQIEAAPLTGSDNPSVAQVAPTIATDDPLAPLAYAPAPPPTVVLEQHIAAPLPLTPVAAVTPMTKPKAAAPTLATPPAAGLHHTGAGVPILMYHHIAVPPANADAVRRSLSVTPAHFAAQLDYLSAHGYHVVSLTRYVEWMAATRLGQPTAPLPANPVVLTFDDGYDDIYSNAYPLLQQHGMVGTFFIITSKVGWPGYVSWLQLQKMSTTGMDIESHTVNHVDLSRLNPTRLKYELAASKRQLETGLGKTVTLLCYPAGGYNRAVEQAAWLAGYTAATTTRYGWSYPTTNAFELPRVRVAGAEALAGFVSSIGGTLAYKERR